jgi:hypothetical protein
MFAKMHVGLHLQYLLFFFPSFNMNVLKHCVMLCMKKGILLTHGVFTIVGFFLSIHGCCIGHLGFTASLRHVHCATADEK